MAGKTITMHQIKQVIELLSKGHGIRSIVRLSGISRNTVRDYKCRIQRSQVGLDQLLSLDDDELISILFDQAQEPEPDSGINRIQDFQNRVNYFLSELGRRGVTRQLLWEEYKSEIPSGYSYTQFCDRLSKELNITKAVMYFKHQPGAQLMVDYAGDTLSFVDRTSGEIHPCQVLICTLPYSNYTYVEALPSQKQDAFISGLTHALDFLGGAPQSIKCDNLRSAVTRASRYEPVFTEAMDFFASYYQITAMAARVRKPRDKASVENAVGNTYRRIYAPLRDRTFYSLKELNHAIAIELEKYNAKNFQKRGYSRKEQFEKEEKQFLKKLPAEPYFIRHTAMAKVQKNYHVILGEDFHQYSVPYTLIGKRLKIIYTIDWVEIYHEHRRIALHARSYKKYGYTTMRAHMPANHVYMHERKGWNVDSFMNQAETIGGSTQRFVARILSSKIFPEQTFNSCLGIFRLGKQYGNDRLEAACLRAIDAPHANYGIIQNILKNGLDKINEIAEQHIPAHGNIRGGNNYQ